MPYQSYPYVRIYIFMCLCVCVCVCVCVYVYMHVLQMVSICAYMIDSIENATPVKSTKSRNSIFSIQIQIKPKFHFEFVPQDSGESEFLDSEDFWDIASVETVACLTNHLDICIHM